MSMVDQGSDRCAWVCRCSNGLRSVSRPLIHILAGEKVCIHAITPMQSSSAFAATITARMPDASVSTVRQTTSCDWAATWASVSSP